MRGRIHGAPAPDVGDKSRFRPHDESRIAFHCLVGERTEDREALLVVVLAGVGFCCTRAMVMLSSGRAVRRFSPAFRVSRRIEIPPPP
jgi:hypothetical protein